MSQSEDMKHVIGILVNWTCATLVRKHKISVYQPEFRPFDVFLPLHTLNIKVNMFVRLAVRVL